MLKDLFKTKQRYVTVRPASIKRDIPDGLWTKCKKCGQLVYNRELVANLKVCHKCGYHFPLSAQERIALTLDEGSFTEQDFDLVSSDPLEFPGYPAKIEADMKSTGLTEAVVTGQGTIGGFPVCLGVMDFRFRGASMGSVVGEKVTRLLERAIELRVPVVIFASSGGARMHEGILSLMQMAKTSAAVSKLNEAGILYISILTDPTTGGVFASFASLGDIILAEPGAQIRFAGARVIEETLRQKLPPGFATAEFVMSHGFIDRIVERKDMRKTLIEILALHDMRGGILA